jgi:hypothetical protein
MFKTTVAEQRQQRASARIRKQSDKLAKWQRLSLHSHHSSAAHDDDGGGSGGGAVAHGRSGGARRDVASDMSKAGGGGAASAAVDARAARDDNVPERVREHERMLASALEAIRGTPRPPPQGSYSDASAAQPARVGSGDVGREHSGSRGSVRHLPPGPRRDDDGDDEDDDDTSGAHQHGHHHVRSHESTRNFDDSAGPSRPRHQAAVESAVGSHGEHGKTTIDRGVVDAKWGGRNQSNDGMAHRLHQKSDEEDVGWGARGADFHSAWCLTHGAIAFTPLRKHPHCHSCRFLHQCAFISLKLRAVVRRSC